jgi:hypothetical protein
MHRRHAATPTNPTLEIKNKRIFRPQNGNATPKPNRIKHLPQPPPQKHPAHRLWNRAVETKQTRLNANNSALNQDICTTPGEIHKSRP